MIPRTTSLTKDPATVETNSSNPLMKGLKGFLMKRKRSRSVEKVPSEEGYESLGELIESEVSRGCLSDESESDPLHALLHSTILERSEPHDVSFDFDDDNNDICIDDQLSWSQARWDLSCHGDEEDEIEDLVEVQWTQKMSDTSCSSIDSDVSVLDIIDPDIDYEQPHTVSEYSGSADNSLQTIFHLL